jgi:hypothetical protein
MTIYREPPKDAAADYAEAQRVWKSAREIAEWDAAFADAKAHPAPLAHDAQLDVPGGAAERARSDVPVTP